jgi:hypothetical protein
MVELLYVYYVGQCLLSETYLVCIMLWKLDPFPSSDIGKDTILLGWALPNHWTTKCSKQSTYSVNVIFCRRYEYKSMQYKLYRNHHKLKLNYTNNMLDTVHSLQVYSTYITSWKLDLCHLWSRLALLMVPPQQDPALLTFDNINVTS